MFRSILGASLGVALLAGCAETGGSSANVAAAEAAVLPAGTYSWQLEEGCAQLTLGGGDSYAWDRGCDGSIDYRGTPRVDGSLIKIDMARLNVESVTETGFTGTWRLQNNSSRIVATRS